mgnify:CR=1 FL=1
MYCIFFQGSEEMEEPELYWMVRLTFDGRYAIWVENLSLKVCRLSNGRIIANTSTHEIVTSLELLDYGYLIVIGREDGHMVTMKLMDLDVISDQGSELQNVRERKKWVLNSVVIDHDDLIQMHPNFQKLASEVQDTDLPRCSKSIEQFLKSKANVPHAIIVTQHPVLGTRRSVTRLDEVGSPVNSNEHSRGSSPSSGTSSPDSKPSTPNSIRRQRSVSEPRGSLSEFFNPALFSPSRIVRSTSGLFSPAFAELTGSHSKKGSSSPV